MADIAKTSEVLEQYADDSNFKVRQNFGKKYSAKSQEFQQWVFEQMTIPPQVRILEVGCGNGTFWDKNYDKLPTGVDLILTDISPGMVKITGDKFKNHANIETLVADIQNLPFDDEQFDIVIAKHMLYHVPDVNKGLREVVRVLKPNGKFYATGHGSEFHDWFHQAVYKYSGGQVDVLDISKYPFSLLNGVELLSKYFDNVKQYDFYDPLEIPVDEAMAIEGWARSSQMMFDLDPKILNGFAEYVKTYADARGTIVIPKHFGLVTGTKRTA